MRASKRHHEVPDVCEVPRCRRPMEVIYFGRAVCGWCWNRSQTEGQPEGALRRALRMEGAR